MQVKKFEASTIQEALETIKRELGPEAIILQTKQNRRGFGLMSKASVEVTAAVSDKANQRKSQLDRRLPDPAKDAIHKMPAEQQAQVYRKYEERQSWFRGKILPKGKPEVESRALPAIRYADIADSATPVVSPPKVTQPAVVYTPAVVAAPPAPESVSSTQIHSEIQRLRDMISEMKREREQPVSTGATLAGSDLQSLTVAMQEALEQMLVNGLDKRIALNLVRQAAFSVGEGKRNDLNTLLDQVALDVMASTEVSSLLDGLEAGRAGGPSILALIGPTGVGKTTTVAKIASDSLLKKNLKVGMINLDSYRVGATDQLSTYAKILGVPFRTVTDSDSLKLALADFKNLDLVLIDTTGRSQKDVQSLQEMVRFLDEIPGIRKHLVLSATTRDAELAEMGKRFQAFRPEGLIFSKLDEAMMYGAIYNLSQKLKLPLVYFTTGQRVPEDLEPATRERVAALVMDL